MFKFFSAVKKEYLLLSRDIAGIIILFLMPMVLIIIMSLLQEVGWNAIAKEPKVEVLFVNNDGDSLGINMENGLRSSGFFDVIDSLNHVPVTKESARAAVKKGDYLIAIVIPKGVTKSMRENVRVAVAKTLAGFGMFNPMLLNDIAQKEADTVTLFFDPTIRKAFKNAVVSSIKEFNYRSETGMVFRSFNAEMAKQFPAYKPAGIEYKESLQFKEVFPNYKEQEEIPTTVQHNVPAWAIFAMFFIIIPLTGSMIKEREEGSLSRLMSMPVAYIHLLLAKVTVYFFVCLVQTFLMIFSGIFILPLFHIPMLIIGNHIDCIDPDDDCYSACRTRLWSAGWNHCKYPPAGGCFRGGFDHYPCRNRRNLGPGIPDAYYNASCGRDQSAELGNNRFLQHLPATGRTDHHPAFGNKAADFLPRSSIDHLYLPEN